jgi:hypothetical protein
MFSPLMAVFMAKACSGLRLVLRQGNWRRSSGTRFSRCFFAKERSQKISSRCSCHGLRLVGLRLGKRHSGFNVFCGPRIQPGEEEAIENLARYIIRASFSQERMTYVPGESKVLYQSKDGQKEKAFDVLEWLAAMCSHVPNRGEQMVRYYGHYSNVSRGKRKRQDQDGLIPSILEPVEDPDFSGDGSSKEHRKNWARLIQKIYQVDPLTCVKCGGTMGIISFIEDPEIVKKILKHLGLWDLKPRPLSEP